MVSVTSLGSGSKGNATIVSFSGRCLLIDSGFSCKELERRLVDRGISPSDIDAVLVTHEHSDHFKGVPTFSNKHSIPVWMSHGTSLHGPVSKIRLCNVFNNHSNFSISNFLVKPIAVPHDSREASQFIIQVANRQVGILTDLGHITPFVSEQYSECDMLLLEFNHDRELLAKGRYPMALKARVSGSLGHLSNEQAAEFLKHSLSQRLTHLAAMHISEENNSEELVSLSIAQAQLNSRIQTILARQESGFDWVYLGES